MSNGSLRRVVDPLGMDVREQEQTWSLQRHQYCVIMQPWLHICSCRASSKKQTIMIGCACRFALLAVGLGSRFWHAPVGFVSGFVSRPDF